MTSSSDNSDSRGSRDEPVNPGSQARLTQLEIARRIARETLQADRQALELDAR